MKKMKLIATMSTMILTCSMVSAYASYSGYKTVQVNSGNAVTVATGTKTESQAYTGAWLSTIGEPDAIMYWAYSADSTELLTNWVVTEHPTVAGTTYDVGVYRSGVSSYVGKGVKVIARARDASWGSFPINTNVNFY